MEPFTLENKEFLRIKKWEDSFPFLVAGFTTKNGGKSTDNKTSLNMAFHVDDTKEKVVENRQIVASRLYFPLSQWVGAEQTHKKRIKVVTKADIGSGSSDYESAIKDTDGLFTLEKNVLLTLCYADCVPLYFIHPKTKAIGIAHAGWQGTVQLIAKEMIEIYAAHQIPAEEIQVVIGPAISDRYYRVDNRVIDKVDKVVLNKEKAYQMVSPGQYQLNLQEVNKQVLMQSGVRKDNIEITNYCTFHDMDFFYSHRRDNGDTGRMMSYIGWREGL
ncbi:peptidoglycan editing factor PgeF [Bacillus sp. B1-b2]|uniref:peptidoglycan editing factor PgeF n=1 Tax=Bacillus sp. B1-b2 TaxID=2653201 RepID=UPI00126140FB|nr:peptidoglycan editing factor PgeF [Bacillus sp. B1-b2]KAB7669251.1 peptidoglycan editing factor PgeF [Bacillus sp. B1-b2]